LKEELAAVADLKSSKHTPEVRTHALCACSSFHLLVEVGEGIEHGVDGRPIRVWKLWDIFTKHVIIW
jgi:desulfoferrodoxin (superoxide reductase-like protein)